MPVTNGPHLRIDMPSSSTVNIGMGSVIESINSDRSHISHPTFSMHSSHTSPTNKHHCKFIVQVLHASGPETIAGMFDNAANTKL